MYDSRVDFLARPPLVTRSGPRLLARPQYSQKREHGGADVDPTDPASAGSHLRGCPRRSPRLRDHTPR